MRSQLAYNAFHLLLDVEHTSNLKRPQSTPRPLAGSWVQLLVRSTRVDSTRRSFPWICLFALLMGGLLAGPLNAQETTQEQQQESKQAAVDTEIWEGTLQAGANALRLEFILQSKGESWEGTLVSIDQGGTRLKIESASKIDGKFEMQIPMISGGFAGKLNDAGDSCEGHWKQGPVKLPLTLKRTKSGKAAEIPKVKTWEDRPQRPKEPFPYKALEVTINNDKADVTLAGTLTLPATNRPCKAVVLVSGSGPQDRDETLMGHKPFMVIADHLSRRGIAVLRFDDRGIGKSTGKFATATTQDFATDAQAAVEFLASRPEINAKAIGILGHSEGGLIAPIVANQTDLVAFNVLLAGPGIDGGKVIQSQSSAIAKGMGAPDDLIKQTLELNRKLIDIVRNAKPSESIDDQLKATFKAWIAELPEDQRQAAQANAAAISTMSTPWFRNFLVYDPAPALKKNKIPTLALLGGKDLQVLVDANRQPLQDALDANGVEGNELIVFENKNHLFQNSQSGLPTEYAKIDETIDVKVLDKITSWIQAR